MWYVFLTIAIIGVAVLLVHLSLEINALEKNVQKLAEALGRRNGPA